MLQFIRHQTELELILPIGQLAAERARTDDPGEDTNLVDWYCESHMDSLSESHREMPTADKLSYRAFTSKLRIAAADLKQIKNSLRFRDTAFNLLGLSTLTLEVLAQNAGHKSMMFRIRPTEGKVPTGPYNPKEKTLRLIPAFKTLAEEVTESKNVRAEDALAVYLKVFAPQFQEGLKHSSRESIRALDATVQFAGLFNVEPADLEYLIKGMRKAHILDSRMQHAVAEAIVQVIGATPQFRAALNLSY